MTFSTTPIWSLRAAKWALVALAIAVLTFASVERLTAQGQRSRSAKKPAKLAPPPKWDRKVLETFFPDARQHLGAGPAPGSGEAATVPAPSAVGVPTEQPAAVPAAAAGTAREWSALIAAATLEDEVKSLVKPTAEAVQSPTAFKGGAHKNAREGFSMLAVVFNVIDEYDGQVRWKKDAPGLRALFARAGANCKVGTDNSFAEAKLRSQDLTELVRGGNIQPPAKIDKDLRWPDVAGRAPLMKRMDRALRERLQAWTASPAEFNKNRAAVLREAQLLAVLAEVIKSEGYDNAEDATYQQYVSQLQAQCLELIEAVKSTDTSKAQSVAGQMNKTCDACHADFRSS